MDNFEVVITLWNPKIKDNNMYVTLLPGWLEGHNTPKIIVRFRKSPYGLQPPLLLWHDAINTFLISLGITESLANPNLYLPSDGILILLWVDDTTMFYPEAAMKAGIEVHAKL